MSLIRPIPRKPSPTSSTRDCRKRVRESEEPSSSLKKRLASSPRASSQSLTPSSTTTSVSLLKGKSDPNEVLSRNSPISPRLRSALEVLSSYSPAQGSNRSNNKPKLQSPSTCKRTGIQGKDDRLGSPRKASLRRSSSPSGKLPRSLINKIEKPSLQKSRVVLPNFSYPTSPSITKRSIKLPQKKDVQVIFNNMPTKVVHPGSSFLTPPAISPCCHHPSPNCSAPFGKNYFIVPSSNLPSVSPFSQSHLCTHQCWQGNLNQGCGCPLISTPLNYPNSQPISIEPPKYSPPFSFHNQSTSLKLSSDSHQNSTCRNSVQSFGSAHHEIKKRPNDDTFSPEKRCSIDSGSSNISSPILHNSTLSPAHVRMETEAQIMKEYQKLMDLRAQELVFRDMQKQLEASLAQMNQTQILVTQPSACNLQERQSPSSPSRPIVL